MRALACLALLAAAAAAQPIVPTVPAPEVAAENAAPRVALFDLEIDNRKGGAIIARLPGGTAQRVGTVRRPARRALPVPGSFHASYYVNAGIVCATAVNAIHVKAGPLHPYDPSRPTANPAVNFNLAPADVPTPGLRSAPDDLPPLAPLSDASEDTIYTDVPGGTGCFGGPYAPLTGSPCEVDGGSGWEPLARWAAADPTRPLPARVRLRVSRPALLPHAIEIENWARGEGPAWAAGNPGRVRLAYDDAAPRTIAVVLKRVRGTGNFEGGQYAGVGALRANHPGVICLSTAPRGQRGGLQIVPANHARYMRYPENPRAYQWLVVASVASADAHTSPTYTTGYLDTCGELNFRPPHEGLAPLFGQFLPAGVRFEVRRAGAFAFEACPTVVGKTEPGLGDGSPVDAWEAIRILSRPQYH